MRQADQVLEDDVLLSLIQQELALRFNKSTTRGRPGTPAEVVLRMLLLKHMRDFSFQELSREVRANLVYRQFTRVGGGKVPDEKTIGRLARQLRPELIKQLHDRFVAIARKENIIQGRKMRVDTTVVETNIHYPTDSSLLGDGVQVLTRAMKKVGGIAAEAGAKLRDRSRSVKLRVMEIARAARSKVPQSQERLKQAYGKLLDATSRVVGQARRFSVEIAQGLKRSTDILQQAVLDGLRKEIDTMLPRVQQVIQQTRTRIFGGETRAEGKILSLFEPSTEVIRNGKAGKPNEFGKMVKLQEAENQIVTDFEVYQQRPSDSIYSSLPSNPTNRSWDVRRVWWRPTLDSTLPAMRRWPKRKASKGSVCLIALPKALTVDASRKNAGSAMARSGGPDARGGSA